MKKLKKSIKKVNKKHMKKIKGGIKDPSPPVEPALGQHGVN